MSASASARLGDFVEILSGFAFDAANFSDEGDIALIRIRDVLRGRSNTFYRGAYDEKYLINEGEILIGMDGEFNRARWQSAPALLNQRVCKISSNSPRLADEYLFHFLPAALKSIEDATSFVTVKHLSAKQIRDIEIPLPPVEEQRRIAAILDQAETLRTQRRRALAHLDTLTQSLFLDMFGDPVANDRGWPDSLTLGEVADIASGVTKGRNLEGKITRELPYLAVANVQDKSLRLEGIKSIDATEDEIQRYLLRKNDLLLTEGGDPDKLGRGTLWNDELPECIHQNHIFRVRLTSELLTPLFLNWLVGSPRGKKYFLRSAKQTTGIASINMTQLKGFPLLVPPLPLQQTFATRIQAIEALKATHRTALAQLDALFASLQQRAFAGEL